MKEVTKVTAVTEAKPKYVECYVIYLTFMHGDADYYSYEELRYETTEEMIEMYNFLVRCYNHFPHGMGGDDGYWDVEGYEALTDAEQAEDGRWYDEFFPRDNEYCSGHATVREFKVKYYGPTGQEFDVAFDS